MLKRVECDFKLTYSLQMTHQLHPLLGQKDSTSQTSTSLLPDTVKGSIKRIPTKCKPSLSLFIHLT